MDTLIEQLQTFDKKSLVARFDDNGKLIKNIANFGLKKGECAFLSRNGEYHLFGIKAIDNIRPLLTTQRIIKALICLRNEDLYGTIQYLCLEDEVNNYGFDVIYYVLDKWLTRNKLLTPEDFLSKIKNKYDELDEWVTTIISYPILGQFAINKIGETAVVPEEWIGKIFIDGKSLHQEIDKLDWRKGKPKTCFCCIYSMIIEDTNKWSVSSDVKDILPQMAIKIRFKNSIFVSTLTEIIDKYDYEEWIDDSLDYFTNKNIIFGVKLDELFIKSTIIENKVSVGVLVSRMQKCIRRGPKCCELLSNTIRQLGRSKPYNLPEQQFVRVSGTRQLFWRLFISCIEDSSPYECDNTLLTLNDIVCLATLANVDPDLQINEELLNITIRTGLAIQNNNKIIGWRNGKNIKEDNFDLTFENDPFDCYRLANRTMMMMSGDRDMIVSYMKMFAQEDIRIPFIKYPKIQKVNKVCEYKTLLASNDMHCFPNIILLLQGSTFENLSSRRISSFIWNNSSKINFRKKVNVENTLNLKTIQCYLLDRKKYLNDIKQIEQCTEETKVNKKYELVVEPLVSRIGFLLLFGKEVNVMVGKRKYSVIVAGDNMHPCRVKKGDKYFDDKIRYLAEIEYSKKIFKMQLPSAPEFYHWTINTKYISLRSEIKCSDKNTFINEMIFYVNDIALNPFDVSPILKPNDISDSYVMPTVYIPYVKHMLFDRIELNDFELNMMMRKGRIDTKIYDWVLYGNNIINSVWRTLLVKLSDQYVTIGPVDRGGEKDGYEGVYWRLFNLFCFLYPKTIRPKGELNFSIDKSSDGYFHLIKSLKRLAYTKVVENDIIVIPKIITEFWDHQKQSIQKITHEILVNHRKGFGDASYVGSGKTLTAIGIMIYLLNYNIKHKLFKNKGFVIMVPSTKLYKTWVDEINKHTNGIHVVTQNANGSLSDKNGEIDDIQFNSFVITTMGRMREHPLEYPWQFVIIDECLTVQNKDALQTCEAWRQTICSQYGVLMLSATFFRTRFDKLLYMLQMLQSGLPSSKEYLNTILNEHIVCFVPEKTRKWSTRITKFELDDITRKNYDKILRSELSSKDMYVKLSKFLYDNLDYVNFFHEKINEMTKDKTIKILIYARSKKEADNITCKKIGRYPDISKKHVVLTYAEGTYGLNDLIKYNTILTRPPEPDKLPQMKGRLDRYGQTEEQLKIEYIIIKNTIEEALIWRLEIANIFYKNYIIPLAEFYEVAIGKREI